MEQEAVAYVPEYSGRDGGEDRRLRFYSVHMYS